MNCANCGGPLRLEPDKDFLACDYCKSIYFPEPNQDGVRILGEPLPQLCPCCQVPLLPGSLEQRSILYCQRCRGMLVPLTAFLGLVQVLRANRQGPAEPPRPPNLDDLSRHLNCPLCLNPMDTHPYAGPGNVIIDNCPNCSQNWLDHNELLRIAAAPDTQINREAWDGIPALLTRTSSYEEDEV